MSGISAEPILAKRLTLVPLRAEHAREMTAVLADPALYTFTGGTPPSPQELRARYERWTEGSPDPGVTWCNWVIQLNTPQSPLAGTVQATISVDGGQPAAEVAWIVGTQWQGQGIATEAARALVGWLRHHSIRTVTGHIHPSHHASAAVAAAAGLTPADQWHDGERQWQLISGDSPRCGRSEDVTRGPATATPFQPRIDPMLQAGNALEPSVARKFVLLPCTREAFETSATSRTGNRRSAAP